MQTSEKLKEVEDQIRNRQITQFQIPKCPSISPNQRCPDIQIQKHQRNLITQIRIWILL